MRLSKDCVFHKLSMWFNSTRRDIVGGFGIVSLKLSVLLKNEIHCVQRVLSLNENTIIWKWIEHFNTTPKWQNHVTQLWSEYPTAKSACRSWKRVRVLLNSCFWCILKESNWATRKGSFPCHHGGQPQLYMSNVSIEVHWFSLTGTSRHAVQLSGFWNLRKGKSPGLGAKFRRSNVSWNEVLVAPLHCEPQRWRTDANVKQQQQWGLQPSDRWMDESCVLQQPKLL